MSNLEDAAQKPSKTELKQKLLDYLHSEMDNEFRREDKKEDTQDTDQSITDSESNQNSIDTSIFKLESYRERLLDIQTRNPLISQNRKSSYIVDFSSLQVDYNQLEDFVLNRDPNQALILGTKELLSPEENNELHRFEGDTSIGPEKIAELVDKYTKQRKRVTNKFLKIDKKKQEILKDTGRYCLYLGFGFIRGGIDSKKSVNAPIYLIPIKVQVGLTVIIQHELDRDIRINKSVLLAIHKNTGMNASVLLDQIDNITECGFSDNQFIGTISGIAGLKQLKTNTIEKIEKSLKYDGFEIYSAAAVGIYSPASGIYTDYDKLKKVKSNSLLAKIFQGSESRVNDRLETEINDNKVYNNSWQTQEIYNITPLDQYQEYAVFRAAKSDGLVIYGPPGTGKSQVILNIIADQAARGKRILMVSQKATALKVVYNRLGKLKLKTMLVEDSGSKREFREKIQMTLNQFDMHKCTGESQVGLLADKIDHNLKELDALHDALTQDIPGVGVNLSYLYKISYLNNANEEQIIKLSWKYPDILEYQLKDIRDAIISVDNNTVQTAYKTYRELDKSNELSRYTIVQLREIKVIIDDITEVKKTIQELQNKLPPQTLSLARQPDGEKRFSIPYIDEVMSLCTQLFNKIYLLDISDVVYAEDKYIDIDVNNKDLVQQLQKICKMFDNFKSDGKFCIEVQQTDGKIKQYYFNCDRDIREQINSSDILSNYVSYTQIDSKIKFDESVLQTIGKYADTMDLADSANQEYQSLVCAAPDIAALQTQICRTLQNIYDCIDSQNEIQLQLWRSIYGNQDNNVTLNQYDYLANDTIIHDWLQEVNTAFSIDIGQKTKILGNGVAGKVNDYKIQNNIDESQIAQDIETSGLLNSLQQLSISRQFVHRLFGIYSDADILNSIKIQIISNMYSTIMQYYADRLSDIRENCKNQVDQLIQQGNKVLSLLKLDDKYRVQEVDDLQFVLREAYKVVSLDLKNNQLSCEKQIDNIVNYVQNKVELRSRFLENPYSVIKNTGNCIKIEQSSNSNEFLNYLKQLYYGCKEYQNKGIAQFCAYKRAVVEYDSLNNRMNKNYCEAKNISDLYTKVVNMIDHKQSIDIIMQLPKLEKRILEIQFNEDLSLKDVLNSYVVNIINRREQETHIVNKMQSYDKYIREIYKLEDERCSEMQSQIYSSIGKMPLYDLQLMQDAQRVRGGKQIRQLMTKYFIQIFGMYNIWLMTPDAVQDVLPMNPEMFDIVVFDEAQQMFLESQLPQLYRAKKAVVAGDDKQLKPTQFFKSLSQDDESEYSDDDDYASELPQITMGISLLDQAKIYFSSVKLQFHYRQKYQELIQFSNHFFYENSLKIAPNIIQSKSKVKPIEYILVKGKYCTGEQSENDKAVKGTNPKEASECANLIVKILQDTHYIKKSIGVITFNIKQKATIIDAVDQAIEKATDLVKTRFNELNTQNKNDEDQQFFVKNLEDVQGDERDIIIFQLGYGFDYLGKLHANLGPLQLEGGENRLNVAVSRAKEKEYILQSIIPTDLNVENSKNNGPKLFKLFLQYAYALQNGDRNSAEQLVQADYYNNITDKRFDSPFEKEVYDRLTQLGYNVETQVGVRGYRIDLAIWDQELGSYLAGIECDGAFYHSQKYARERDVSRQRFLEGKGWRILRVWQTNWWHDSQFEIQKIDSKLKAIKVEMLESSKANEKNQFRSCESL